MPDELNQTRIDSILKRAKALEAEAGDSEMVAHAEVLARLVDKTTTLDDLPDEALEACRDHLGTSGMVDALLQNAPSSHGVEEADMSQPETLGKITPETQSNARTMSPRSIWRRSQTWLAIAAAVTLVLVLSVPWLKRPGQTTTTPQIALTLTGDQAFNPASLHRLDMIHGQIAAGLPDFTIQTGTLGATGSDPHEYMRLGTVIVRSENGYGSGAFISADGWLLTNYHVVADPAQTASLTGQAAKVEVITAHEADGHNKPEPAVSATVYRVDPEHDLALLKLDTTPAGMTQVPFFKLATSFSDTEDCFVVGSQFNGPAWWVRGTNISQRFDFPDDLSQVAAGVDTQAAMIDRSDMTVLVSDARVSPGDSGGPLLNAKGELIGLTFATSANSSAGSVGWHIALKHLRAFLTTMPTQPEGVPFDLWTAGLPHASMLEPQLADADGDGRVDSLVWRFATAGENGQEVAAATVVFIDLDEQDHADSGPQGARQHIPQGLWGVKREGNFTFDVCIVRRADGVAAVAYTDASKNVNEIRIGHGDRNVAQIIWRRGANGAWTATPGGQTPLIDPGSFNREQLRRLQATTGGGQQRQQSMNEGGPRQSPDDNGPRKGRNSLESTP